jgi:hypothetical protein
VLDIPATGGEDGGMQNRGLLAVALAASLLAVSGCGAARPVPPPASYNQKVAEHQRVNSWLLDGSVAFTGGESLGVVRFVPADEWPQVMADCLNVEGMYVAGDAGGLVVYEDPNLSQSQADLADSAWYTCTSQYPRDPVDDGYLTMEQRGYQYDYFQRSLIPCLTAHGLTVVEAPRRIDYITATHESDWYSWNPYLTVGGDPSEVELSKVQKECPYSALEPTD